MGNVQLAEIHTLDAYDGAVLKLKNYINKSKHMVYFSKMMKKELIPTFPCVVFMMPIIPRGNQRPNSSSIWMDLLFTKQKLSFHLENSHRQSKNKIV